MLVIWIWLTVYDLRKNIGQDFWIWFYFGKIYRLWTRKDAIFFNKILWKIAGKAVLDDLNRKIFLVFQPWWPTGFLGIYQVTAKKWNYLITMTAGIQNVFFSAELIKCKSMMHIQRFKDLKIVKKAFYLIHHLDL